MSPVRSAIIAILVLGVLLFVGLKLFGPDRIAEPVADRDLSKSIPSLTPPVLEVLPNSDNSLSTRALATFENYLKAAKAHDLTNVKNLSYQTSHACNDPVREKECFALMDSVYAIASQLEFNVFKHIRSDDNQIILFTDSGSTVVFLYFTRTGDGTPKVLGMRFCIEDETTINSCVEKNASMDDSDNNGWWDSIESLFYKN